MIKEEYKLKQTFGNENHFTVPDGYFDSFTSKLMEQLPEREARVIHMQSWWQKTALRKVAAAVCGVLVIGTGTGLYLNQQAQKEIAVKENSSQHTYTPSSDATFNEVADYTMLDNQSIYASLMAENY